MKKFKLGIDLGSRNVKVSCISADGTIRNGNFKSLATTNTFNQKNVVVYDGEEVALGIGAQLIEQDKTERKYLEQTVLISTEKITGLESCEIDLSVGLPISTFRSKKKQKLQDRLDLIIGKTLEGTIDGKSVNVKINSAKICAEGYSGFLTIAPNLQKMNTVLIDLGYKTIEIVYVAYENGEWILRDVHTIDTGMYDLLSVIKERLYDIDVDMTHDEIDTLIRENQNIPTQAHGSINVKSQYLKYARPVVEDVMQEIKIEVPSVLSSNIYLIGGWTDLFETLLNNDYKNVFTVDADTSLYANSEGYVKQI